MAAQTLCKYELLVYLSLLGQITGKAVEVIT